MESVHSYSYLNSIYSKYTYVSYEESPPGKVSVNPICGVAYIEGGEKEIVGTRQPPSFMGIF